ncbi:MAG: DUF4058 family protein [Chloroflexaceae bacterium]|nr:DUF4058 family protein [Chloroflexaceae bacterium]
MPSPFPGMDPYLEGYLWPDVHHRLATEISRRLAPRLRPRYVARLEIVMVQDSTPEADVGILYPDVEVIRVTSASGSFPPVAPSHQSGSGNERARGSAVVVAEPEIAPFLVVPMPFEVRLVSVEIRDVAHNKLVTCIEMLSPVNKREPGLTIYRGKRQRLFEGGVHVLEIDLLRRGTRPVSHPAIPATPYLVALTRSQAGRTEVWPVGLRERLPVVAVPLRAPDADVPLELGAVLVAVYEEAAYDLSINYQQPPPPPPIPAEDAEWVAEILSPSSSQG